MLNMSSDKHKTFTETATGSDTGVAFTMKYATGIKCQMFVVISYVALMAAIKQTVLIMLVLFLYWLMKLVKVGYF